MSRTQEDRASLACLLYETKNLVPCGTALVHIKYHNFVALLKRNKKKKRFFLLADYVPPSWEKRRRLFCLLVSECRLSLTHFFFVLFLLFVFFFFPKMIQLIKSVISESQ